MVEVLEVYLQKKINSIVQIVDVEKMAVDAFPWIEEAKENELENISKLNLDKYILIADDSKPVLNIMSKIMEKLNVKCWTFESVFPFTNASISNCSCKQCFI
jgi:hypothetical protein